MIQKFASSTLTQCTYRALGKGIHSVASKDNIIIKKGAQFINSTIAADKVIIKNFNDKNLNIKANNINIKNSIIGNLETIGSIIGGGVKTGTLFAAERIKLLKGKFNITKAIQAGKNVEIINPQIDGSANSLNGIVSLCGTSSNIGHVKGDIIAYKAVTGQYLEVTGDIKSQTTSVIIENTKCNNIVAPKSVQGTNLNAKSIESPLILLDGKNYVHKMSSDNLLSTIDELLKL